MTFALGIVLVMTACIPESLVKPAHDCTEDQANNLVNATTWCVDMCALAYSVGWLQGIDCAVDETTYQSLLAEWGQGIPKIWEGYTSCGEVNVDGCGDRSSHSDSWADSFDYGYLNGWMESACSGSPEGSDLESLPWPVTASDSDEDFEPGWYPCPGIRL